MPDYHWTPTNKRAFLEELAATGSVSAAARFVGMAPASCYRLIGRQGAALFALGWQGAMLIARDVVAAQLLDRALNGHEVETVRDPETGTTRRRSCDHRLGLNLLTRLDKRCFLSNEDLAQTRAFIAASHFERLLELVEEDAQDAEAEAFLEHYGGPFYRDLRQTSGVFDEVKAYSRASQHDQSGEEDISDTKAEREPRSNSCAENDNRPRIVEGYCPAPDDPDFPRWIAEKTAPPGWKRAG